MDPVTVRTRVAEVRERVGPDVTIVAVTKGFGGEAVLTAASAGIADVGENYAQELVAKVATAPQPPGVRWHFLGHLQTNKVKPLAPLVHLWQSVDRVEAGRAIVRHAPGARVLVQVNVSGLPRRNGCGWDEAAGLVEDLSALGLDVRGLMAVASEDQPRRDFRRLARLARGLGLRELSMGMSGDFEVAVDEGATMVRLGTVLFGPRPGREELRR